MDVSIIVPFYKGNKWINRLLSSLKIAIEIANKEKINTEIILVNDSPDTNIEITIELENIKVINNSINKGIHYSRVQGIKASKGEFILMIDQDDTLSPLGIVSNYNNIFNHDVVIGNGAYIFEVGDKKDFRNIYSTQKYQKSAAKEKNYLYVRDLIVSPGQCLIRKTSIPSLWLEKYMNQNGADDYLLWLLMFNANKSFTINNEIVYTHHDSGENLSFDFDVMEKSTKNLIDFLSYDDNYAISKIKKLKKTTNLKLSLMKKDKKKLALYSLIYPNIFIYNIYYRIFVGKGVVIASEMREKN